VERWRRTLTWALGGIWLLDAALQYQPYMFTAAFPRQTITSAGAGSPGWVRAPVDWAGQLLASNLTVVNGLFATIQLVIALGLFWRATVKLALAGSIIWALTVWWLGEGLGGVLAGPVSPAAGLPGAVILYALAAALLWPRTAHAVSPQGESIATASPLRPAGARLAWLALWAGFVYETLLPASRAPNGLHSMIAAMATGEPGWIAHINTAAGSFLAGHGVAAAFVLATACTLAGLAVLAPRPLARAGIVLALVLAAAIWVIGEDFGQIATGTATDPNTGLPLALLALCYWPLTTRHTSGGSP
jgi:hypothetical protein